MQREAKRGFFHTQMLLVIREDFLRGRSLPLTGLQFFQFMLLGFYNAPQSVSGVCLVWLNRIHSQCLTNRSLTPSRYMWQVLGGMQNCGMSDLVSWSISFTCRGLLIDAISLLNIEI